VSGRGERRQGEKGDGERRAGDTPAIRHRRVLYRTGPAAALILVALTLASCGGGSSSTTGGRPLALSTGQRTTTPAGAGQRTTAKAGADGDNAACAAPLGDFVDRMDDLRQSLLAGLSYAEYVVRVRAIRDAYEAVPIEHLGVVCLTGAAGDAEEAFNQYLRAGNVWGECAGTAGCAASEIEGRLQRRWRIASKRLEAAKQES
jgi:hypothetical protein